MVWSAGARSSLSTGDQSTRRFRSSTMERLTALSLCSGLLRRRLLPLLRLRANRRKPDYSRTIDDVPVGIEARPVTRAVPRFFRVVPVYDAVQVRADS